MMDAAKHGNQLGDLSRILVNRIAHRGETHARDRMNAVPVTLQQVIMLHRLSDPGINTPSNLLPRSVCRCRR